MIAGLGPTTAEGGDSPSGLSFYLHKGVHLRKHIRVTG